MKMIMAVIKPFKLDDVRERLVDIGVEGMTVTEVKGFGRQKAQNETYRGADYSISYLSRIKIEIAVEDKDEKKVLKVIQDAATTGRIGDGKIFVYDLTSIVRIRTGESGGDAL